MRDSNGNDRDVWVMLDQDGDRTLFKLVEVGNGGDVGQLARELHAPAVVVDMALPALPALDEMPGRGRPSGNSRLILLKMRTVTGGTGNRIVVREGLQVDPVNASTVRADLPRVRSVRGRV